MARDLGKLLLGGRPPRLASFRFRDPKTREKVSAALQSAPLFLDDIGAVGKRVIFQLAEAGGRRLFLVSFLSMSAIWSLAPSAHTRSTLTFDRRAGGRVRLYFNDVRGWGKCALLGSLNEGWLAQIGPDLLTSEATLEAWLARLRKPPASRKAVADILLDQSLFSGVGNYLRADILYRARADPRRTPETLAEKKLVRIYREARTTMLESYRLGGHTQRDYFRIDGRPGDYRPCLYGLDYCPRGHRVQKFADKHGRTVHWCPSCQS